MNGVSKQRILVAPLDWGLGHATRCAQLIDNWLKEGHEVIMASNGRSAAWLKQRYPNLEVLTDIPDYAVTYPSNGSMSFHFAKHLPRLFSVVRAEHRWLQSLVAARKIDLVYSDNRYGLYHEQVPCTLITHQLYVRVPCWAKPIFSGVSSNYFKRFHSIWIPDLGSEHSLSGALSHGGLWDNKVRYIGSLSRFAVDYGLNNPNDYPSPVHIVALISGPEPSRTAFEQQLRQLLGDIGFPALLILGMPDTVCHEVHGDLTIINHLPDKQLANVLQQAQLVICRSGYSTIMDLDALNVRALLVPTPGQTEQEYLAEYHTQRGTHRSVGQKQLSKRALLTIMQSPHT
jgi:predicted glycosyltransferase